MSRGLFIKTCLLLAVTTHARAQYIDFFSSFLQPYTTVKPRNDVTKRPDTKHRQANKQKYQDVIFFETDDFLKQRENTKTVDPFNIFVTTTKPRRKSKTTTTTTTTSHYNIQTTNKPKTVNSNIIINNNNNRGNQELSRSINNDNNVDNRFVPNARRIDNNANNYNIYNIYGTTKAPNRQTTQRTTQNYRQTTRNPLLNRPGVRPAVVDHNRPPITNRPVTQRPYNSFDYTNRPEPRPPVNTRPPFESERPTITTGVAQPVPSGANEDTEIDIEIGPDEDDMTDAEKRRLYDVCEKKCQEYKSMHVRKVVALPLGGGGGRGAEVNVSSCAPDKVPLIVGGQLAKIETFPHMALLGWKYVQSNGYAWKCGGSLVSERFVLTAGHCTYHDKDYNVVSGPPAAVQLGSSIYNDGSATVVSVALVVRHPKYKLRRSYYDVALLKLAADVTFSDTISPACLGVPPEVGQPIIATGWGKTEFGGDSSIQLRSVSIPIWDMTDCREIWGTSLKLPNGPMPDNQICAGERKGSKDTCQGDSGGPAQVRDGCAWRVVAVTSVGRSCGARDTPALYARVPRAFVAKQVYTNIKTGRDGNNQYGNVGNNRNDNGNTNWNSGQGNNRATVSNQNGNWATSTRDNSNNNSQDHNNNARPNNQDNRGIVNNNNGNNYDPNNRYNNWGVNTDNNNRYNQNNNRNVYDQGHNVEQTTVGYNQNFGQSFNEQNQGNPSDIRNYGAQSYGYDNGSSYNTNTKPYVYPVVNKPWWMK